MRYRHILLDFDGTLTAPDQITAAFLEDYRAGFLDRVGADHAAAWDRTLAAVRLGAPQIAWMLEGYEACSAAADPYILASVTAARVLASVDRTDLAALPNELYQSLYTRHAAPFRPEAPDVLAALQATGANVAVVSNASTGKIEARLDTLLGPDHPLRGRLRVIGQARKFAVREATRGGPHRARFDALPDLAGAIGIARPTWLRRGAFFDALADVWGDDADAPASTVFCGDIWELDLALPAALGCSVHLVERAAPLATHEAERAAVAACASASFSADLNGLLARVQG
jgi:phosphoglycolate phosphatase-like HAD superfamily hydrolase